MIAHLSHGVSQVNSRPVVSNDVPRPRVFSRATSDEPRHLFDVVGRHHLWVRHVQRNTSGHAELVATQVGIRRDHRPRGEVDSLPHEVSPDASLFALDALPVRLQRLAIALSSLGLSVLLVVYERGEEVLQERLEGWKETEREGEKKS